MQNFIVLKRGGKKAAIYKVTIKLSVFRSPSYQRGKSTQRIVHRVQYRWRFLYVILLRQSSFAKGQPLMRLVTASQDHNDFNSIINSHAIQIEVRVLYPDTINMQTDNRK